MSLPALRAVSQAFPHAALDVLARPWVADLYQRERCIRQIVPLAGAVGLRDIPLKWKQSRELAREQYDVAILFPNSFESAVLLRAAGVPRRLGYNRDARGWLLTQPVHAPSKGEIPAHQSNYYLELLRRGGVIRELPAVNFILFDQLSIAREKGHELFRQLGVAGPVVGVAPGAAYGSAKRWLPERFAAAAREIASARNGEVVVFGSASEREVCEQVASATGGINLAGRTNLRDYLDLTAACMLFLTNDSGAMHVAYASGIPSLTIFGPTREDETGPLGDLARIVRHPVECSPCMLRECPIDHRCMTRVTSDRVVIEASNLIEL